MYRNLINLLILNASTVLLPPFSYLSTLSLSLTHSLTNFFTSVLCFTILLIPKSLTFSLTFQLHIVTTTCITEVYGMEN